MKNYQPRVNYCLKDLKKESSEMKLKSSCMEMANMIIYDPLR